MPDIPAPRRTAADYLAMLQHLLPQGRAWTRALGGRLTGLLLACGDELGRVDGSGHLLMDEANPLTTLAALEDWERVLGLPDACTPAGSSLQERRAMVIARLNDLGRQDIAYYRELAASLGYDVDIEEFSPFICGVSECGGPDMLGPEETRYWWNITVYGPRLTYFRCGESAPYERLGDWRAAEDLECIVRRDHLAHDLVTFTYLEWDRETILDVNSRLHAILHEDAPGIAP